MGQFGSPEIMAAYNSGFAQWLVKFYKVGIMKVENLISLQ